MSKPINTKCLECSKFSEREINNRSCWFAPNCRRMRNYYRYHERKKAYQRSRHRYLRHCASACRLCGCEERLEVHHIRPQAAGGSDGADNLMTLCHGCHNIITRYYKTLGWNAVESWEGSGTPSHPLNININPSQICSIFLK